MFQSVMFMPNVINPEAFLDTLCGVKKFMTDKIVTDQIMNKAAHNFIDAQRAFAKMMLDNHYIVSKHSMDTMSAFWFPKRSEPT